jgi:tyrosyl-tRNA synthetase
VGGSDQWGNLVSGVDLIRRVEGATAHALATPLVTKPDGTKYGKTEGGAIWIGPDLMSPYAFYQFWLNRADEEIPGLLRVFSFSSREEIEALEQESRDQPARRLGQRALAEEMTTLVHGADETAKAIAPSAALFGQGDLAELDVGTLDAALAEIPHLRVVPKGALFAVSSPALGEREQPTLAVDSLAELPTVAELMAETTLVQSRSEARRVIASGGAYLNNVKVTEPDARPGQRDLLHGRFLVLRRGKRTLGGVIVQPERPAN